MIKADRLEHIECVRKALYYYKLVVDECDKHEKYREVMDAELGVCREMVGLLPAKLDKMVTQASL